MRDEKNDPPGKISLMPMAAVSVDFGDVQMVLDGIEAEEAALRFTAAQALCHSFGKQKLTRALKPLVGLLDDPTYFVRWAAALALGELGDQRAVKPLVDRLDDGNFCVRIAVVDSLGKLGNPYVVESLIKSVDARKEQHAFVRAAAARALGAIRDERAPPPLLKSLKDEYAAVVISAISGALGDFDDKTVVEPLIWSLSATIINKNAAISLGKLRKHVTEKQIVKILYLLKNGHSYQLRAGCALAIGEIGWEGTSGYLKEAAMDDSSVGVHWAVAKALRKTENKKEALTVLLELLRQKEKPVFETALESILEVISDTDYPTVKESLSVALISLDDAERESAVLEAAKGHLKCHLETPEEKEMGVRCAERKSFFDGELMKMEEMADIRKTLKRIEGLEKKGTADAVESLTGFLKDENGHVRKAASESLERLLKKANSPEVNAALSDTSCEDSVRRVENAARILAEGGKTMMFDGKVFSRKLSKKAPTVPDTPRGRNKKTLI